MGNLIHISRKIKDMKSILKIAEALQLISLTKWKGYMQMFQEGADYNAGIKMLFEKFYSSYEHDHKVSNSRFNLGAALVHKFFLWIVIGSDLSLCGRFNKQIVENLIENFDTKRSYLIVFGKKVKSLLQNYPKISERIISFYDSELPQSELVKKVGEITTLLLREFINRGCYYLRLLYRGVDKSFKIVKLLPFTDQSEYFRKNKRSVRYESYDYRMKPLDSVIELFPTYAEQALLIALMESKIAEHDQRREIMSNAIKSVEEKLAEYNLIYQKARQATITQEISEITAALKCKT
ncbi:F0F1 ATP synthase subunit gamma [Candidatus Mycoplasma haematominutum]|uniref:ATP synthase, gamma subunit n=1 Tax=Candidatus Mycoplasma haematominutum 'Birmingham 1' TaxID=1116213 RepID=G8C3A1_9MOLU|nr:F0F1 ATP synthase subunit gamma [Candidatus Mycoplasma haematominutum]CCE66799.1 ATP synthase, gamma subunit [Candidatus Mycoplasma haematominutum 'Birmingham 1']